MKNDDVKEIPEIVKFSDELHTGQIKFFAKDRRVIRKSLLAWVDAAGDPNFDWKTHLAAIGLAIYVNVKTVKQNTATASATPYEAGNNVFHYNIKGERDVYVSVAKSMHKYNVRCMTPMTTLPNDIPTAFTILPCIYSEKDYDPNESVEVFKDYATIIGEYSLLSKMKDNSFVRLCVYSDLTIEEMQYLSILFQPYQGNCRNLNVQDKATFGRKVLTKQQGGALTMVPCP